MKRRYLYVLLFSVPTCLASSIITIVLFGTAVGILWLFVLGDNPWPSMVNTTLVAMLILTWMTLWVALMAVAYVAGKRQEAHAALNAKHVVVAAGATALLVLLIVVHQWSVGNIGPKGDSQVCSEFCQSKGFAGSGMPPRDTGTATCSCFDAQGREAVKVPMGEIPAVRRK